MERTLYLPKSGHFNHTFSNVLSTLIQILLYVLGSFIPSYISTFTSSYYDDVKFLFIFPKQEHMTYIKQTAMQPNTGSKKPSSDYSPLN